MLNRALRTALARYPLYSGAAAVVGRCARLLPDEDVTDAALRDGGRLLVKTHDFIGRTIVLTGDYDRKLTWLCRQVLRPGDTMLDIGANVGVLTAYGARLVGPSGAVHAFEPQPELASLLQRSMILNGYDQVVVHPYALSDTDRRAELHVKPADLGSGSLDYRGADRVSTEVDVRRAADVLDALDLGPIRLLKVDIEGHEAAFLDGASDYLRVNTPEVIAFESCEEPPFHERPVVALLHDLGYEFSEVPRALLRMKLRTVTGNGLDYVGIHRRSRLSAALT